jgi:hypothetical protein
LAHGVTEMWRLQFGDASRGHKNTPAYLLFIDWLFGGLWLYIFLLKYRALF